MKKEYPDYITIHESIAIGTRFGIASDDDNLCACSPAVCQQTLRSDDGGDPDPEA